MAASDKSENFILNNHEYGKLKKKRVALQLYRKSLIKLHSIQKVNKSKHEHHTTSLSLYSIPSNKDINGTNMYASDHLLLGLKQLKRLSTHLNNLHYHKAG